jgi:hypothetical protein
MARYGFIRAMIIAVWSLLCLSAAASADQQSPDVTRAVNEIVAACAILPMNTIEEPLSAKLGKFLQQSLATKSAKSSDLTDLFAQLPTDTEKGLEQVKDPGARNFFFSTYFTCIRQQTSLKLKSWNITLE